MSSTIFSIFFSSSTSPSALYYLIFPPSPIQFPYHQPWDYTPHTTNYTLHAITLKIHVPVRIQLWYINTYLHQYLPTLIYVATCVPYFPDLLLSVQARHRSRQVPLAGIDEIIL